MSCDYCWPGNCCGGSNCRAAPVVTTAHELRKLAAALRQALVASPCMSVAAPAVDSCIDHLTAIAAVHDTHRGK